MGFELFDGKIDEVRIFSFQPGEFAVGDLNLPRALPPPPSTPVPALLLRALALLGFGVFGLAGLGLRRRRSKV